jgi:hypothetical protein
MAEKMAREVQWDEATGVAVTKQEQTKEQYKKRLSRKLWHYVAGHEGRPRDAAQRWDQLRSGENEMQLAHIGVFE